MTFSLATNSSLGFPVLKIKLQPKMSIPDFSPFGKYVRGPPHGRRTFFALNYPLVHLPDFLWICVYSLFKIVQQTNPVS